MEYGWPTEFATFRAEVRQLIEDSLTPQVVAEIEGLGHGGRGGPAIEAMIREVDLLLGLAEAFVAAGTWRSRRIALVSLHPCPRVAFRGISFSRGSANMIAPAISRFGTEEQKRAYVPKPPRLRPRRFSASRGSIAT